VSKQQQTEAALRESKEMLRLVIDSLPVGVFWKDRNSMYRGCNAFFAANAGLQAPEEIIGKSDYELPWKEHEAEAYIADDREVIDSGAAKLHYEETQYTADGRLTWVRTSKMPLKDVQDHIIGVLGTFEDFTKQKLAEEALKETEERYRLLIEHSPAGIFLHQDDRFVYVNEAFARIFGYTAEDMVGMEVLDIIAPETRPSVMERQERRSRGIIAPPRHFDMKGICRDERIIDLEIGQAEFYLRGKVTVIGTVVDVTERKRVESALHESRDILKSVLDTIPAGVYWKDRNSVYLGCNYLFAANGGLESPEQILGKTDFDLPWGDAEAQSYIADDRTVISTGIPKLHYEETQHTADGKVKWVSTSKVPMTDAEGNIIGVLGSFEDITNKKQGEEDKKTFYRETISSVTGGILDIVDKTEVKPYIDEADMRFPVMTYLDTSEARHQTANYYRRKGMSEEDLSLFSLALGEAMANAVKHAGGGLVFVGSRDNEVWGGVSDTGSGISALTLPQATLRRGFSTKVSMGMGYSVMLEAADKIMLNTGPEGTTVVQFRKLDTSKCKISIDDFPDIWDSVGGE
jgi:PAS domain S-box-containing protein